MQSKGCLQLIEILQQIYPNQKIITEYYLGDKLYLDILIPAYNLGFEYDGPQHDEFNSFFHKDQSSFLEARKRDLKKSSLAESKGLTLIRVSYKDPLTKEFILDKILETY